MYRNSMHFHEVLLAILWTGSQHSQYYLQQIENLSSDTEYPAWFVVNSRSELRKEQMLDVQTHTEKTSHA